MYSQHGEDDEGEDDSHGDSDSLYPGAGRACLLHTPACTGMYSQHNEDGEEEDDSRSDSLYPGAGRACLLHTPAYTGMYSQHNEDGEEEDSDGNSNSLHPGLICPTHLYVQLHSEEEEEDDSQGDSDSLHPGADRYLSHTPVHTVNTVRMVRRTIVMATAIHHIQVHLGLMYPTHLYLQSA